MVCQIVIHFPKWNSHFEDIPYFPTDPPKTYRWLYPHECLHEFSHHGWFHLIVVGLLSNYAWTQQSKVDVESAFSLHFPLKWRFKMAILVVFPMFKHKAIALSPCASWGCRGADEIWRRQEAQGVARDCAHYVGREQPDFCGLMGYIWLYKNWILGLLGMIITSQPL